MQRNIFDDEKKRLLIRISESEGEIFYRLADNLIVGMVREIISSLILEDLLLK